MTDNPLANIENLCFFDTETRAERGTTPDDGNVKTAGTYRYAQNAFPIILTTAIGTAPVFERHLTDFDGDFMCWEDMPYELREFHKRAEQREAWYAAWNAGFDMAAWNEGTYDFPLLEPDMCIDIMAQAVASNLPPALEGASRAVGNKGKQDDGKYLINLFCSADGPTPQDRPEEWRRFLSYAVRDTDELRDVYARTRPLPFEEWEDYWVSEEINRRGIAIDLPFVERAGRIADAEAMRVNEMLVRWTNGQITKITQAQRIAEFVYDRLDSAEARAILVKEWDENASTEDGEDADVKVGKLSLERGRIEALLAYFNAVAEKRELYDTERLVVDIITARQFGGSAAPFKFRKMLMQHDGGRLKGQYVFNGAAQTGRFSSKGVQIHNLTRSHLGAAEEEVIEMINELELT